MALFKQPKKVVVKTGGSTGAEISPLRPRYAPKLPPCSHGCPNGIDIRGWVTIIAQHEAYGRTPEQAYEIAWRAITDRNPFPAVCGRVCPHPCEGECNRNAKEGGVAINALERFIGDFGIEKGLKLSRTEERRPERVAVVGAGPAGLSCAYQLAKRGYDVTVFEAFSRPGGMLRYGIPAYRLPRCVLDAEIERIVDLGVELRCGVKVGRDVLLDQLRGAYQAVFVGIGAHKGRKLGVPGEDGASNVFTGTEFLNQANRGEAVQIGGKVIVIGGGDTAIDAARVSKRMGADVTILYRRTRAEMPAIAPEIEGALEEGIKIEFLAAPVEILRNNSRATGMRCIRMELGEPDKSGRPRPVPKPGSEFELEATAIIAAISQEPDFDGFGALCSGKDWINADEWGATAAEGVYAGGDDVELGLVTIAIAQGRFAAEAIDAHFRGTRLESRAKVEPIRPERMKIGWYKEAPRNERAHVPPAERAFETEIEQGFTADQALAESKRCMSCGMCMDCETCWMYCTNSCFVKLPKGEHYRIKLEVCNGCKKCAEECPCGYIDLV